RDRRRVMTGTGGGPTRPRPVRGSGGGWASDPGPGPAKGPQESPGAGSDGSDEADDGPRDALSQPRDLGRFDEDAEPAADGIAVGSAPPPGPPGRDVFEGDILGDVAAIERERDEYLHALQRLQADFDNYRKRMQRQHHEESAKAALDLVNKLL